MRLQLLMKHTYTLQTRGPPTEMCSHTQTHTDACAKGLQIHQYLAIGLKCRQSRTYVHAGVELHLPLDGPLTTSRGRKVVGSGVSLIPTINHTLARQHIQLSKLPTSQGDMKRISMPNTRGRRHRSVSMFKTKDRCERSWKTNSPFFSPFICKECVYMFKPVLPRT